MESRITVDHVWKKFAKGQRFDSLKDLIPAHTRRLLGLSKPQGELGDREFWSVRDVSFDVGPGHVLGVIGHNGAGKSTTLKLLTRILRPTRGHIEIKGRIGALIEVAAGFHPDLTGRENVYLQGSIMGMKRQQIANRFDEIVAFAGVSEFIDTPVKRYSSGMNARLGFAIAAHLDPDVLIIDEVLAVGDAEFQKRAFARIAALSQQHIPVVVVSHQLDRILSLCTECILLERGVPVVIGTPSECVVAYTQGRSLVESSQESEVHVDEVAIDRDQVAPGDEVSVKVRARCAGRARETYGVGIIVRAIASERVLYQTNTARQGLNLEGRSEVHLTFRLAVNLGPGAYYIDGYGFERKDGTAIPGPRTLLTVQADHSFYGEVQMNGLVELRDDVAFRETLPPHASV